VLSLDVALGEYDFERVLVEAEPDRCRQGAAVLPVGGEDAGEGASSSDCTSSSVTSTPYARTRARRL
jgi:hypothetical protein